MIKFSFLISVLSLVFAAPAFAADSALPNNLVEISRSVVCKSREPWNEDFKMAVFTVVATNQASNTQADQWTVVKSFKIETTEDVDHIVRYAEVMAEQTNKAALDAVNECFINNEIDCAVGTISGGIWRWSLTDMNIQSADQKVTFSQCEIKSLKMYN